MTSRLRSMDVDAVVTFESRIYLVGLNRCIDVPADVASDESRRSIPVILTVAGRAVRTNLVSRGRGLFRVYLNSDLREAAGVDVGDLVAVELRLDLAPREPRIPAEFAAALAGTKWARPVFEAMTLNQRREMVRFVTDVKSKPARARRIARIMEVLQERRRR